MKSYLEYIWHNPNCKAWHREHKTNKPYKHLVEKFGNVYICTCGYDEDFSRLQKFIKQGSKENFYPRDPEAK